MSSSAGLNNKNDLINDCMSAGAVVDFPCDHAARAGSHVRSERFAGDGLRCWAIYAGLLMALFNVK